MHMLNILFVLLAFKATHAAADSVTVKLDLIDAPDWTHNIRDGYCSHQGVSRTG
ncbi:uncharacterized protein LDX57_002181 [Aspergillus melleus]|uniref:uncharacterized protein n=1 Tax=Aspergillus melleus TaxID=138277 RepID=UPI001E8E14A3|nr:uncharacterized protein LDX57_002181 [Aspergillus melleus]KAH8424430.1 hypothetical protein LDX57_002181 [Aspergillus melleus]